MDQEIVSEAWTSHSSALASTPTPPPPPPPTHLGVVTQDGRRRQGVRSAPGDLPLSESQTWTNCHDINKKVKQLPGRQTSRIVSRSAHRPPPTSLFARVGRCLRGTLRCSSAQPSYFAVSVSIEPSAHLQSQVSPRMIEQGFHGVVVVMQGASIAWTWVPGRRRRSTASGLCSTLSMMDTYPTGTALFEQRKDMPLPQPRRTPAAPQCDKRKASLTGRYPQWPIGSAPSRLNHEIISPGGG